jgi:hypothetical protein
MGQQLLNAKAELSYTFAHAFLHFFPLPNSYSSPSNGNALLGGIGMLITNNHSTKAQAVHTPAEIKPCPSETVPADSATHTTHSESVVSDLALRLSAAALRAQIRDMTFDPQALGQKAAQIIGELSSANGGADGRLFKGMPRDQLALITYDESGTFTLAERTSARQETADQELLWRQTGMTLALSEYNATGKTTVFLNEALTHFKSLPLIEQVQYPSGYAADLQSKVAGGSSKDLAADPQLTTPMEIVRGILPEVAFAKSSLPDEPAAVPRSSQTDLAITKASSTADRGRQLMVSRLFGSYEPPVVDTTNGIKCSDLARVNYEFLTKQDRQLLSEIYAYVQDKDVDMTFVDFMAWDLGGYRLFGNGRFLSGFNGGSYNLQGWQVTVSFTETDAAIASRMLGSAAMNSTRFDQGFLRHILNPTYALGKSVDFGFMEHLVTEFSAEADTAVPLGSQFSNHIPKKMGEGYVMTTSTTVRKQMPEPDFIT